MHIAVANLVQRADGADDKWRRLHGTSLFDQRLGLAALNARNLETKLSALGYVMVPREDGNGSEIGGVSQEVTDLFSSRAVSVSGKLKELAEEYERIHGKPPSRRNLWLLHQQAGQRTRRTKAEAARTVAGKTGAAEPTEEERLRAWEKQAVQNEVQALSLARADPEVTLE